ncbi:endosialin-like isoform X2 [Narcine bancroftii]|uniref:endosialin-like isoform X2 n=1 Tax=Narcine bancroftii TaxID=1343680 RepID=UPI003831F8C9
MGQMQADGTSPESKRSAWMVWAKGPVPCCPCRLAVDGYLCRYTYRGMCSPIELGLDEPVLYAAPFGITSTTLHHIPFGSVATLPCSEPVSMLCALSKDGAGVGWSGHPPFCQPGGGGPHHGCPPGFKPAAGGRGCVDADECAAVPCHHLCVNTAGSFRCRCRVGYALRRPGGLECVDVDECQFQGSCQQMCVNYPGHFECHCGEGFALEEDGSSCRSLGRVGVSFAVHEGLPPPIPGEGRGGLWPATGGGDPFPEPSTGILLQSPETPLWVEPLPNQTGTPVREDPFPNQSGTTLSGDPLPALSGTSLGIDPLPEWSGTPMKGDHFPDSSTKTPMSAEPLPDWSGIPMGKDPLTNTSTRTSMRVDPLPDWFGTPVRGDHFPNPFTESTMNVEPLLNWSGTPMGKDPLTDTSVGVEPLPDQSKIPVRGDLLPELSETHMKDPLPNMSSGSPERGDPHPTSSGNPVETDRAPPHQPEGIPTLHRDAGHPGESREAETARWLLAALLVPVSVLGVVMLALAVACCARGRSRNATNVYRWISRSSKASDASVHGTGCIPDATETGAVTTTWQTDISTI